MKIVIDISEKAYNLISGKTDTANIDLYSALIQAVKNGTPFPEGHVRLKEVLDKIRAEIVEMRSKQNVGVLECLYIIDKYRWGGRVNEDSSRYFRETI